MAQQRGGELTIREQIVSWLNGLGSLADLTGGALPFDALRGDVESEVNDTFIDLWLMMRHDYREATDLFQRQSSSEMAFLQPRLFPVDSAAHGHKSRANA